MLDLINVFIGGLITALSSIVFGRLVLNKKLHISNFKVLLLLILSTLILQVFYLLEITVIKSVVAFVLYAVSMKYAYNISISKSLILEIFYIILLAICDILVILICVSFFSSDFFYNVIAGGLLSNLFVSLVLIFITYIFRNWISKISNIDVNNNLLFLSFLIIVCVIYIFYYAYSNINMEINDLLGLFCIVILLIVLINLFLQAYKNERLTREYDNLLEFIKKYEVEIDKQRILRHETKNQLLTIKSKLVDNDKQGNVIKYIDELLKDDKKIKHSEYAKFKSLPSNGIKGLFYFKVSLAQDKNISVSVNVSKSIENSFLGNLDSYTFNQIGKVLGVFLDNAIEGAELSDKKNIGIEIFMSDDGSIVFIISNTYDNKIKPLFGKSSKGIDRGYGLILVRNIINNNTKLSKITEVTDELYIQKFVIKK